MKDGDKNAKRTRRGVALLFATAIAAACGSSPAQPVVRDWLALGDSYSSGEGTDESKRECGRSETAYASMARSRITSAARGRFDFLACSGALVSDVEAQLDEVPGVRYDLVTLGVGGNDAGYASVLADCIGIDELRGAVARKAAGQPLEIPFAGCNVTGSELSERVAELEPRIAALFRRIVTGHLTKHGRLIVVGYPHLFEDPAVWPPDEGKRCDGIRADDVVLLRETADVLASLLAGLVEAADAAGRITFLDTRDTFRGHGRCGADPWINGFRLRPRPMASFHPNNAGHEAVAELVLQALGHA